MDWRIDVQIYRKIRRSRSRQRSRKRRQKCYAHNTRHDSPMSGSSAFPIAMVATLSLFLAASSRAFGGLSSMSSFQASEVSVNVIE